MSTSRYFEVAAVFVGAVSLASLGPACGGVVGGSDAGSQPPGNLGAPCFPNGTCHTGLTCVGNICTSASAALIDGGVTYIDGGVLFNDGGTAPRDVGSMAIDGGVEAIDGGLVYIDGGVLGIDGGVVNIDGGVVNIDGGVISIDGGVAAIDGGARHIDGGVVNIDGGVEYVDGGAIEIDGGTRFIDGGALHIDGGVEHVDGGVVVMDGGVRHLDGGMQFVDGGLQHVDGGRAYIDGGVAYIDGGVAQIDGGVATPDGGICDPDAGVTGEATWVARSLLPEPTGSTACAKGANGRVYCFGGQSDSSFLTSIIELDPVTEVVVTRQATLPTSLKDARCAPAPDGLIYCLGGYISNTINRNPTTFVYDPGTDMVTSAPGAARIFDSCNAAANGRVYCFEDFSIWEHDPVASTTTLKSSEMPNEVLDCVSLATGRIACLVDVPSMVFPLRLGIAEYDATTDSASMLPGSFTLVQRIGECALPTQDRMYCFGGGANTDRHIISYDFNTATFALRPVELMTGVANYDCAAAGNGTAYCFGGHNREYQSVIQQYVPPCGGP